MSWRGLILIVLIAGVALASGKWDYLTPDQALSVTMPFSAAHDVGTFNLAGGGKRTGFYIDSVTDKKLFGSCPDVREFGVWSEPFRDEASHRKFVTSKFGSAEGAKETALQFGSYPGFQLERAYVGYKGVQTYERVVGVRAGDWSHSFYCMWHRKAKEPAVVTFFSSIKAVR